MSIKQSYPALKYFLATYLHQDFMLEFGCFQTAVHRYIELESCSTQQQLMLDLKRIIASPYDEAKLTALLFEQLGCEYDFSAEWVSSRAWLTSLKKLILAAKSDSLS
ncbi:contact-dependent growth inhibition system immunity protein [Utexia brackfieldae]|uniref:contact-dependent growth inhibition system immunity protein n=1 Tax=Utexia brackfieldae TaxID=3074108 RepID=UPI00370D58F9